MVIWVQNGCKRIGYLPPGSRGWRELGLPLLSITRGARRAGLSLAGKGSKFKMWRRVSTECVLLSHHYKVKIHRPNHCKLGAVCTLFSNERRKRSNICEVPSTFQVLLLLNQTWVHSPTHSKANLLTLGRGEGKCSVYFRAPSTDSKGSLCSKHLNSPWLSAKHL